MKLSHNEYPAYEEGLKHYRDLKNLIDTVRNEGAQESIEIGTGRRTALFICRHELKFVNFDGFANYGLGRFRRIIYQRGWKCDWQLY